MNDVLKTYLKKLTNLSSNNRSLLLLRLISDQFMDIHAFNFQHNRPSFQIIEDLIASKKKIELCPHVDSRDEEGNQLSRRLKKLQRMDRFIFEERGARDLYVGWPFIRGKFSDGSMIRCPLLFFPVTLELVGNNWQLKMRPDVNITLNKSFLLAYSYFNKVSIDDELVERVFDDFEKDSRIFRTSLYELLKESPVELNFNQENFIDTLSDFENFKKSDFESTTENGVLKLYPEAVLGIFPQAGSYLVPDYVNLIENDKIEDIESFFDHLVQEDAEQGLTHSSYFFNKVKEEQTFTPFSMDAHQENALKAVKRGNSVVIQGPPGTGKSQLICNLISDFMARGKRVLLVCQKRAALDVVYSRLNEINISDFVALVHDFKNDRKDIYEQIASQIDSLYEYKVKNNSLDIIQLDRKFLQASRKIDQLTEDLEEFKQALFDESECGVSIKELYLTSLKDYPSINIKQEYRQFNFNEMAQFIGKLRDFTAYARLFDKEDYVWKERQSFAGFGIAELNRIIEASNDVVSYHELLKKETKDIIRIPLDFESCEYILDNKDKIGEMLDLLKGKVVYEYFQYMSPFEKGVDLLWINNIERVLMECYKGFGPEVSLDSKDLGKFQEVLQRAISSRKNIFKWVRWKLFSKEKYQIKRVLVSNELGDNRKGFNILIEKIDNRLNLEHNIGKLRSNNWLKDIPKSYDKIDFQTWFFHQKKAVAAKIILASLRNFKEYFNVAKLDYADFKDKLVTLLTLFQEIPKHRQSWLIYLTKQKVQTLLFQPEKLDNSLQVLNRDFDSLCEFDSLKSTLASYEEHVIMELLTECKSDSEDDVEALFQNSVRLAWIDHIETKYPVLRSVSSLKFKRIIEDFQNSVLEKQKISIEILLSRVMEQTYKEVEYNRLNNLVTYRDLQHQVTKKRRIWPVRKMIMNFSDEVFKLVPCWLASPESVSAIFPMEEIFDLVIFDEASQCFTERGIPAMYRGKQVVITGDDKQLKPNDLYKVRWEDENEEHPDAEMDSLLNLAQKYLMQVRLMGHYRSKSLDLIDFSNQYFYDNKLKLLPDFKDINNQEPAIVYRKVDGVWEDNRNTTEAEETIRLLEEIAAVDSSRDVGIVTFNARQQGHIMDMLDQHYAENKFPIKGKFFVKNIENVQGDEMDVIIFSTAYAPDEKGKMFMQFGSLNQEGGENRLNVAITRAREKIYVISSILPHQLHVEESRNPGPKLLKAYLQYALDVSEGNYKPTPESEAKYHNDWFLKKKLRSMPINANVNWDLEEELPFADLTVKEGESYRGLILTDDNLYHQSISVKDVHVYTPFTLEKKNWKYRSFFSREYWNDKIKVEEQMLRLFSDTQVREKNS